MRILVVEDQHEIAAIMTALVGRLGHEIVLATTGKDALLASQSTNPDLVLMDIGLPDMDGYEATRLLKVHFDLPVWALTSLPDDASKRNEVGMVGHLPKPISLNHLQWAIHRYVANQQARLRRRN